MAAFLTTASTLVFTGLAAAFGAGLAGGFAAVLTAVLFAGFWAGAFFTTGFLAAGLRAVFTALITSAAALATAFFRAGATGATATTGGAAREVGAEVAAVLTGAWRSCFAVATNLSLKVNGIYSLYGLMIFTKLCDW
ncbi:MAG: hypothetical protein Q7T87_17590 [Polaromonas sp.]|nr:hypothetical protein [Polaromonas sp.]